MKNDDIANCRKRFGNVFRIINLDRYLLFYFLTLIEELFPIMQCYYSHFLGLQMPNVIAPVCPKTVTMSRCSGPRSWSHPPRPVRGLQSRTETQPHGQVTTDPGLIQTPTLSDIDIYLETHQYFSGLYPRDLKVTSNLINFNRYSYSCSR